MFRALIISTILTLSSCSFGANIFDAKIPKHDFSQIHSPETKITRSEVVMNLKQGTSFISFPFLSNSETQIILQNPNIIGIWQENKSKNVSDIDVKQSYFIQTDSEIEIRYKRSKEEIHSQFLETGANYLSIYKGEDELNVNEFTINSLPIHQVLKGNIIESFYIFDSEGNVHNLKNTPFLDIKLGKGSGVYIESSIFSKISWPLSDAMQKQKEQDEQKLLKEKDRAEQKLKKEKEKLELAKQRIQEKNEKEVLKIIFKETKTLPEAFLKALKNEDQNYFETSFADTQLLAQIHNFNKISENQSILENNFWLDKKDWLSSFRVLEKSELQNIGTPNRSIIFLEFLLAEKSSSTGLDSFFRGLSFIRAKDCSWKFDPLTTHNIEKDLVEAGIISEKHLLSFLKSYEVDLNESEDFSQNRAQCLPETSFDIKKKNTFQSIQDSSDKIRVQNQIDESKLAKFERSCEEFSEILSNLDEKNLQEFIYDDENEMTIEGHDFPDTKFEINTCKEEWLNTILNNKFENEINNTDDTNSLNLFLGMSKLLNCDKVSYEQGRDYCYFGAALKNLSTGSCKKINSDSVKSFCAGHIAQKKNKYRQCERVFGEKNNDEETSLKTVSLRNCHLDLLQANSESQKDCKVLKKPFLFFFTKSTPSYEKCIETIQNL